MALTNTTARSFLALALLALLVGAVPADAHPVDADLVRAVNSAPDRTWTAVEPGENRFADWTHDEIRGLLGLQFPAEVTEEAAGIPVAWSSADGTPSDYSAEDERALAAGLPASFDAREAYSSCQQPVRNQEHCGSCWAFAGAETWADNLCISGKTPSPVVLSPQALVSCDREAGGCSGGSLNAAWDYIAESSIPTEACGPYSRTAAAAARATATARRAGAATASSGRPSSARARSTT